MEVCDEGIDALRKIESGRLAIVAVAGIYRTGKSFLLNAFNKGGGGGFPIGSSTESCTRGIWMWDTGKFIDDEGRTRLILLDSEGQGASERTDGV